MAESARVCLAVIAAVAIAAVGAACGGDGSSDLADADAGASSPPASSSGSSSTSSGSPADADLVPTSTSALENGVLVLHTNVPASVAGCTTSGAPAAICADADGDGLVDAWETMVLERMRPQIELDEQEQILSDATGRIGIVARVTPREPGAVSPDDPFLVLAYMILGYSRDYGQCGSSAHNGDNERVVLELTTTRGDATVTRAYTAAHEGSPADDGHVYVGASLSELRFADDAGEPRWRVLASRDKHATYANDATCAAHSSVPCLLENCTADGVADPDSYRRVPSYVNAGEPAKHLVDDLTALGFVGETAWGTTTFCGGLGDGDGGEECAGGNADKLTTDPFP